MQDLRLPWSFKTLNQRGVRIMKPREEPPEPDRWGMIEPKPGYGACEVERELHSETPWPVGEQVHSCGVHEAVLILWPPSPLMAENLRFPG